MNELTHPYMKKEMPAFKARGLSRLVKIS